VELAKFLLDVLRSIHSIYILIPRIAISYYNKNYYFLNLFLLLFIVGWT